jgi:hypothetical protein
MPTPYGERFTRYFGSTPHRRLGVVIVVMVGSIHAAIRVKKACTISR